MNAIAPIVSSSALPRLATRLRRLVSFVGDVDAGDQRGHPPGRAPEGDHDGDQQGDRDASGVRLGDRGQLEHEEVLYLGGQRRGDVLDLFGHVVRIGDETVDRDEGDQRRYERQEGVERHAGGDQREVVLACSRPELRTDRTNASEDGTGHRLTVRRGSGSNRSSGLCLPDRDVGRALAGEWLAVPIAPPFAQRHPREARHQIELGRPHETERCREDVPPVVHEAVVV